IGSGQLPPGAGHDFDCRYPGRDALGLHVRLAGGNPRYRRSYARAVMKLRRRRPHHAQTAAQRSGAAYERGEYGTAFREWSELAATGDPEALFRLGRLYARGHGVIANLADAARCYLGAAEQGHAEAQYQLGLLHLGRQRDGGLAGIEAWYQAAA